MSASGVQSSLDRLNAASATYQQLRGMSNRDVLEKQGRKLQLAVYRELRAIRPRKGSIRSNILERLKAGKFIHIRESVQKQVRERIIVDQIVDHGKIRRGKKGRTNLVDLGSRDSGQEHWKKAALASQYVEREISVRESGIGFLAVSMLYPDGIRDGAVAKSRYGPGLSRLGITVDQNSSMARFEWLDKTGLAASALEGVEARKGQGAISTGVDRVTADIVKYNERKLAELARATLRAAGAKP